ncbi:MAG: DUF2760 domain-containing protein [Gemmataceae bacterium]
MEMWQSLLLVLVGIVLLKGLVLLALSGFQPSRIGRAIHVFFEALTGSAPAAGPGPKEENTLSPEPFRLLKLLQRESRLVDLLMEDLSAYDDATIGSSVRPVLAKARKALTEYVQLEAVLQAVEGAQTTVEPGFDPAAIRLVGAVTGQAPFRGQVCHPGWKVKGHKIPASQPGVGGLVIEQAEVEIS